MSVSVGIGRKWTPRDASAQVRGQAGTCGGDDNLKTDSLH